MRIFKVIVLMILLTSSSALYAKKKVHVPKKRDKKEEITYQSIADKVVICGICRDVEKAIPFTIKNIETLGSFFSDYRVFIYENNSSDKTPNLLKEWTKKNEKVAVTSEVVDDEILSLTCFNKTIQNEFYRPERIARARNIVLQQAMNQEFDDFKYVIWLDLDFEHELPFQAIIDTFYAPKEWDAVFANGVNDQGVFYDSYALRDKLLPIGAELIGDQWWKLRGDIRLVFKPKDPWYPVYSAFGGMGIYKRDAIKGCTYKASVTKDLQTFEKQIVYGSDWKDHSEIQIYLEGLKNSPPIIHLPDAPVSNMEYYRDTRKYGFILGDDTNPLIYRMNSGVCQYPSICEHVPFHASMILRGHDKLFVNPAIVLYYFGRG
jgi:hypothetical protein